MSHGGVNKVILIGNLGADPEVKYTPSGAPVVNVNLATNESWTDRSGERQERTEWHRLVIWRKLAEIVGQYLKKGSKITWRAGWRRAPGTTRAGKSATRPKLS